MTSGTARGRIIDGRAYAAELMEEVTAGVRALGGGVGIATLLVGDDYAAQVYQRRIDRHAAEAGVFSRAERLPGDAPLAARAGDPGRARPRPARVRASSSCARCRRTCRSPTCCARCRA